MNWVKKLKTFHIIKDPVHGVMQFTDTENRWIKPFIDSPNFQRLRHVKQLGMGDLVFPGAVHTRFNHGLGCCYVAGQMAKQVGLCENDVKLVLIAGLLHDSGHGPFSHAFENVFRPDALESEAIIQHEDWTPLFLKDYLEKDFLTHFNAQNPDHPLDASEMTTIKNLIMHREKEHSLMADIVSSQLDADRLDYLRRDGHFCGVAYGDFDFPWLLHCLTPVENDQGKTRLGITTKGIGAIEHYLMARRLMMRNVYQNGKKYASERLLTHFLKALADAIEQGEFPEVQNKNLARFLIEVAKFNRAVKSGEALGPLKKAFLVEQYPLYRRLCDYDIFSMIRYFAGLNTDHPVVHIASRLHNREIPKVTYMTESQLKQLDTQITDMQADPKIAHWQVGVLPLPHQSYFGKQDPILVTDTTNRVRTLQDDSIVINQISDTLEKRYVVYIDRSILSLASVKKFQQACQ
jgi:uncharacterized protein